jgi:hypothetical protein
MDDADDIAPRPRPGFKSRAGGVIPGGEKAHLFAGVLRAAAGCVGLFAALLYLPIQPVTPILAGVSILMMVTGSTSSSRAVRDVPALKSVAVFVIAACAVVTALTLGLTLVLGAGSLGPFAHMSHGAVPASTDDGTIRFER